MPSQWSLAKILLLHFFYFGNWFLVQRCANAQIGVCVESSGTILPVMPSMTKLSIWKENDGGWWMVGCNENSACDQA
jgi:hypothetical protein